MNIDLLDGHQKKNLKKKSSVDGSNHSLNKYSKRISQLNFSKRISQIKFNNKRISQINVHFINKLNEKKKDFDNDLKLNISSSQKENLNS